MLDRTRGYFTEAAWRSTDGPDAVARQIPPPPAVVSGDGSISPSAVHTGLPRVVILGGGFAGLYAAHALRRAAVNVSLIDHHNHHLFQPLLYQVATAALNPSDIAMPIRRILRRQVNCTVILAEARAIDTAAKQVVLADGVVPYDFLIVATGATHSYFGHDDWAHYAPGLKTIDDALQVRRRILLAYEAAERETNPERRQEWLNFVVVGAGPTGVELAGAIAEIARHALALDFRRIDSRSSRVYLIEAGPRILSGFSEPLASKAERKPIGVSRSPRQGRSGPEDRGLR